MAKSKKGITYWAVVKGDSFLGEKETAAVNYLANDITNVNGWVFGSYKADAVPFTGSTILKAFNGKDLMECRKNAMKMGMYIRSYDDFKKEVIAEMQGKTYNHMIGKVEEK